MSRRGKEGRWIGGKGEGKEREAGGRRKRRKQVVLEGQAPKCSLLIQIWSLCLFI